MSNLQHDLREQLVAAMRSGRLSRREFLRRASVFGLALGASTSLAGLGSRAFVGTARAQSGGTLRVGFVTPGKSIDPLRVNNEGGMIALDQAGEYLIWSNSSLQLEPRVAESWAPSEGGAVWTFKIRQGVKFHDGTPLTAKDVVATLQMHADEANGSNALSVFKGVLKPEGIRAIDDNTVEFRIDIPNGNFPYLLSSDNYNTIILPAGYKEGQWEKTFNGCGPWKVENYTTDVGMSLVRNEDYWDQSRKPVADRVEVTFYGEEQARVLAIQAGDLDIVTHFSVSGGEALLNAPGVKSLSWPSAAFRAIHMRTDTKPFDDKRVRQAMALLLDRKALVNGLLKGQGVLGNDSPFSPAYPSTDASVPQRERDVEKAKQLLAAAGVTGAKAELATWDGFEIPDLAATFQNEAKKVGFDLTLKITDVNSYYGDAAPGKSQWYDAIVNITDYGHRGVPNTLLNALYTTGGAWNTAKFHSDEYDSLFKEYSRSLDLNSQKTVAGKIQTLLLDETPYIIPYFFSWLSATRDNVSGLEMSQMAHPGSDAGDRRKLENRAWRPPNTGGRRPAFRPVVFAHAAFRCKANRARIRDALVGRPRRFFRHP